MDSSRANPYLYGTRIHFRFFYFLYLMGPSGGHLLRCVGPIPPAGVLLDSSSPVSEGALCLSEVGWHFLESAQIRCIVFLIGTSTYIYIFLLSEPAAAFALSRTPQTHCNCTFLATHTGTRTLVAVPRS